LVPRRNLSDLQSTAQDAAKLGADPLKIRYFGRLRKG
jgi:hypothetical protein